VQEFFDGLAATPQPLLARTRATLRFDVMNGDRTDECWHLTIEKGTVVVRRDDADAETIVQIEKGLFEDITGGRANAMSAALRGEGGFGGEVPCLRRFRGVSPAEEKERAS